MLRLQHWFSTIDKMTRLGFAVGNHSGREEVDVQRKAAASLALAVAAALATAPAAFAEVARSQINAGSPIYDGLKGNEAMRTDWATVTGVGYVHPAQADIGPAGGDFVAIGTTKGVETGQSGADCPADYDPKWDGYWDYMIGGAYVCHVFAADAYAFGSNPSFEISYGWCSTLGANTWRLYFGGTLRKCVPSSSVGATTLVIGLETVNAGSTDYNIDVKYTNLKKNLTGSTTWSNYGNPGAGGEYWDDNYLGEIVSDTAENFFLPPLD